MNRARSTALGGVKSEATTTGKTFNGVKVFSATMVAQREVLGEVVTAWLAQRPHLEIVEMAVTQSSDAQFHCIAITVFYREDLARTSPSPR